MESQPHRHRQTDRQLREEDASRECKWEGSASKKWLLLLQLSLACVVGNKFCHYGGSYHHANCGGCRVLACSVRHVTRERARGRNRWWGWWSSHTNTTHAKYLESTLVLFHCPVITATVFYRHLLLWGPGRHEQEKTDKWMTNVRLIRTKTLQWTFQGASQDATYCICLQMNCLEMVVHRKDVVSPESPTSDIKHLIESMVIFCSKTFGISIFNHVINSI